MFIEIIFVALLVASLMAIPITPAFADDVVVDPSPVTPEPAATEPGDTTEPSTNTTPEPASPLAKMEKENARMASALSNLQAAKKLADERNTERESAKPNAFDAKDIDNHPALKGLNKDSDGLVEYLGSWVTPEFVINQHETNSQIKALEHFQSHADEVANQARIADAQNNLIKDVTEMTPSIREALMPGLIGEIAKVADDMLLESVSAAISASIRSGESVTPELIMGAFERRGAMIKTLSSQMATDQYRSNTDFKTTYPALNGKGQAGNNAEIDMSKLSRVQRQQVSNQAGRLAEAMRGK